MTSQQQFQSFQGVSSSLTFAPGSLASSLTFNDKSKQDDQNQALKKKMRQKEADFLKEKALLMQQVELLRLQLQESAEREMNLKKMNESVMKAFCRESDSPDKKRLQNEVNESHPKVIEIVQSVKQEFQQRMQQEKACFREQEYTLEKEIQALHYQLRDVQRSLEIKALDFSRQEAALVNLERSHSQSVSQLEAQLSKEKDVAVKQLEKELETINQDIERQVCIRLNERYVKEKGLNEAIIKYQREQQQLLADQKYLQEKIEAAQKEAKVINDKNKQMEDENISQKFKQKQSEKKLREEIEQLKKQKDELLRKLELLDKSKKLGSRNQPTTSKARSLKYQTSLNNKENLEQTNKSSSTLASDDEEKNKLRRQLSLMRCQIKKLEIALKDVKSKSQQELSSLTTKLTRERQKRMNLYEEKIDKNSQLLQDLLEKDQFIFSLNKQVSLLRDRLQLYSGQFRSHTPKNQNAYSLHESLVNPYFGNTSMIDAQNLNQGSQSFSSKQLISPLRSLDFTINNNGSFQLLPFTKNPKSARRHHLRAAKQDTLQASPKQIKRSRVHSLRVGNGNKFSVASSMNNIKIKQQSKDASIAEVNEDLYRDSVESFGTQDINQIEQRNIIIPFKQIQLKQKGDSEGYQQTRLSFPPNQAKELADTLLQTEKENQVYYDSLDNISASENDQDPYYFSGPITQRAGTSNPVKASLTQIPKNDKHISSKLNDMSLPKKSVTKSDSLSKENDDEDCSVNIIGNEENHIESGLVAQHQTSTEIILKDLDGTFNTHKSKPIPIQKQMDRVFQPQRSNQVPKPQRPKQKMTQREESSTTYGLSKASTKGLEKKLTQENNAAFQSPTPLNIPCSQRVSSERSIQNLAHQEELRNDSCPSPIDEDETVVMLGSGEKFKIKEVNQTRLDKYQNQFKEQRHLFSATFKPPLTTRNAQQPKGFQFRSRTDSLINSVSSEKHLKMKFMKDVPQTVDSTTHHNNHTRVPSLSNNCKSKVVSGRFLNKH